MLKSSTKGFDDSFYTEKIDKILDLPNFLEDKALEKGVELEEALINIYRTAPPRGNEKFVWSIDPAKNAKASRYYHAAVNRGEIQTDGKHYKRQGKPPYSAVVNLKKAQRAISFQILLKDPKMTYPFGALNGEDTRNPGHKVTGWNFAYPLINEAVEDAKRELLMEVSQYLEEI